MMNKLLYINLFVCLQVFVIQAQTPLKVEIQSGSNITIYGNADFVKFKIYQNADNFLNRSYIVNAFKSENRVFLDNNEINVPIKSFTSGNKMALRDFFKMMEADKFKTMNIQLNHIVLSSDQKSDTGGKAIMDFTIKGVTKKYVLPINYIKQGNFFVFNSIKQINIKDFGLIAPVAMMGLIKVNNMIDVSMHFVLKIEQIKEAPLLTKK